MGGANPATGAARYWFLDHQGSVGAMHDASKGALAAYEYGPYGAMHAYTGAPGVFALGSEAVGRARFDLERKLCTNG